MKPFNTLTPATARALQPPHSITQTPTQGSTHHWIVEQKPYHVKVCTFLISNVTFFVVSNPPIQSLAKNMLNKKMKPGRSMRFLFHWQINSNCALWLESWWLVAGEGPDYIHHAGSRYVTLCHVMSRGSCSFVPPSAPHYTMLHSILATTAPVFADGALIEFNTFALYEDQHQQSALSIRSVLMKYHRLELKY